MINKVQFFLIPAILYLTGIAEIAKASNIVARWPMNIGPDTIVTDIIGGNNGTMLGLDPATAWLPGGGVRFDNTEGHRIEIPHSDTFDFGDESFTIVLQVRYLESPTTTERWIVKGTFLFPGTGSRYEIFYTSSGTVRFTIDNGLINIKSKLEVPGDVFVNGEWVHVVAVRDADKDTLMLYANGVFQGGTADRSGDISNGEPLWIGESTGDVDMTMSGDIRDVRLYNRALSEQEIQNFYPCCSGTSVSGLPGLVAHWPMNYNYSSVVTDVAGGNNGAMTGLNPTAAWLPGGGIRFDNLNGHHIEVPHSDNFDFGDENFTVSMLIRYLKAPVNTDHWLMKGTHGIPGIGSNYELYHTGAGNVRFSINNGPGDIMSELEVPDKTFFTGNWVHVVAVRDADSDTLLIYANAELQGSAADISGDITNGEPLRIGESTDETGTAMSGDIKDVCLFNAALSSEEIIALFNTYNIVKSDATLSDLKVDGNTLEDFTTVKFNYIEILDEGTTVPPLVTATPANNKAKLEIVDALTLDDVARITVTSEDSTTENVYTITFEVAKSDDAYLTTINTEPYAEFIPEFNKDTTDYLVELPAGTASVKVTATKSDDKATVTGGGDIDVGSGSATVTLTVTAEDGTIKEYRIIFHVLTGIPLVRNSSIQVYPNPVSGMLFIENEGELANVNIYNSQGQIVKVLTNIYSSELSVDVNELNSGIYLLKIETVNGLVINNTFIINSY
jgi:hypothetical protein